MGLLFVTCFRILLSHSTQNTELAIIVKKRLAKKCKTIKLINKYFLYLCRLNNFYKLILKIHVMKKVSMSGSLRGNVGKKDAKALRNQGRVPCVLYGGKEQIHFSLEAKAFKPLLDTPDAAFSVLHIDGKEYEAFLQDIQFHPVSDNIYHADFLELMPGKEIIMSVPTSFTGNSIGVIRGGRLMKKLRRLQLRAFPQNMVGVVDIDITNIDIGQSVAVKDIKIENVRILDNPNSIVATVKSTRVAVVAEPEK
jgi:large subunit ribosomal protein L25